MESIIKYTMLLLILKTNLKMKTILEALFTLQKKKNKKKKIQIIKK